jgi:hypothetical protein
MEAAKVAKLPARRKFFVRTVSAILIVREKEMIYIFYQSKISARLA